jgi:hypothetical protein
VGDGRLLADAVARPDADFPVFDELVPSREVTSDLLKGGAATIRGGSAVDHRGVDRVDPQGALPPACVVEQVWLEAAAHAGGGVQRVLAAAVLDAPAELDLGEVALAQALVLERRGP